MEKSKNKYNNEIVNPADIASDCKLNTHLERRKSKQLDIDTQRLYDEWNSYVKKYHKNIAGFTILRLPDSAWILSVCTHGEINNVTSDK
jgi:hypothetical protein